MNTVRKSEKRLRDVLVLHQSAPGASHTRLRPSDNHLYFEAVACHGSIRKAADALHIASSALNRRILDLEHEVGTALFERLPRGVRLTAAGELLLTYVRWSMKELRKVEEQVDQLRGQMRGVVRIAVAESVTLSLLPEEISAYQRSHPGVSFHVIVDGPDSLVSSLLRDEVDLILIHDLPERGGFDVLATATHPLCALVSPTHPLARRKAVTIADCAGYPLAVPDHSLTARGLLDRAFEEAGVAISTAIESDSIETLKCFARVGQAVCFSFQLGTEAEAHGLVALPLLEPGCSKARLCLVSRRGRSLAVAAAAFGEQLKGALAEKVQSRPVSVA